MISNKKAFGELRSESLSVGDMVEWTRWDENEEQWTNNYGILIKIENKLKSNRIVAVATVKPISEPHQVVELFTISLHAVANSLPL
jgi:hypothetical protein